ncbi:MAG: hypothetical protein ACREBR_04445 [bacterium]
MNTNQFCLNGHDTFVVGRNKRNTCNECIRQINKRHRKENRSKIAAIGKTYYIKNKGSINRKHAAYLAKRKVEDVNFKLLSNLRIRLNMAIKNNLKTGSAVRDLGCTIEFFKQYVESKFYGCMTWDNYATIWQVDHIVPLHKFDLTNREQLLKAVHYTNLQPLAIEDHKKKTVVDNNS